MTEWSKDLVLYRMTRANETLEDARILANAGRWNACISRKIQVVPRGLTRAVACACKRVVRPIVFGIAALDFFDFGVAGLPETRQILCNLYRRPAGESKWISSGWRPPATAGV